MPIKNRFITLKNVMLMDYHCNTFQKYNDNGIALHYILKNK